LWKVNATPRLDDARWWAHQIGLSDLLSRIEDLDGQLEN
jgi:hypothetical protein